MFEDVTEFTDMVLSCMIVSNLMTRFHHSISPPSIAPLTGVYLDVCQTFNKVVGLFSQSVFHWKEFQALTATQAGNLVLWDIIKGCAASQSFTRKAIKLIPLQEHPITVLTTTDRYSEPEISIAIA